MRFTLDLMALFLILGLDKDVVPRVQQSEATKIANAIFLRSRSRTEARNAVHTPIAHIATIQPGIAW